MRERREKPEGWRNLKVGGLVLWWTVGEPRVTARLGTPGTAPLQAITVTLAVQRTDGSGKQLKATIRGYRAIAVPAAGFRDVQSFAIEPSAVRALVELAAPRGAWPTGTGTWTTELELPQHPLPTDLTFRPEHLAGLKVIWKQ